MNKTVKDMAEFFKVLGDPTRLKLLKMLSSCNNQLCVGALAHKLKITQPAVSQHLKVLKAAGIVENERKGFHVHYALNKEAFLTRKIDIDSLFKVITEGSSEFDCKDCQ